MATTLQLSVTAVEGSADAERNTSQVLVVLQITTNLGTYNETGDTAGSITLDGVSIADLAGKKVYLNTTTELYRGVHTVHHTADGSKTVTVNAAFDVNTSVRWIYAQKAVALPRIPRASTLSVPVFTLGSEGTLVITRAEDSFLHTLSYRLGGSSGVIAQLTAQTAVKWCPPLALASELPCDVSLEGALTLTTYDAAGSVVGEKEYPFTVYLPKEILPTLELRVSVESDSVPAAWNAAVRGKSRLRYEIAAQSDYGAQIESCTFTFGAQTLQGSQGVSGILTQSGSFAPQATVTDSRGRSASAVLEEVRVYDYALPAMLECAACRCDSAGVPFDSGSFVSVLCRAECADVGGRNTVAVRCRHRRSDGAWSGYTALENGAVSVLAGFDATTSYEVELSAVDGLGGEKTVVYGVPTASVAFHLGDGGSCGAFGKYAEQENTLECAWNAEFQQDVRIGGDVLLAGGRLSGLGDAQLGGDAVSLGYLKRCAVELLYPIGSIYWSYSHTSPATLFGGEWERLAGGFLWAAEAGETIGETGGESSHTLSVSELPSHTHQMQITTNGSLSSTSYFKASANQGGSYYYPHTAATGGGAAHNNMPPYIKVSAWRRTA